MREYRLIDHTGDLGVVVRGEGRKALFEAAARALFSIITDRRRVKPKLEKKIEISAGDREQLMVAWLTELLFLHEVEELLFRDFSISGCTDDSLGGFARGEHFTPERHVIKTEIKAVTYHQIFVGPAKGHWEARIIFDL